MQKVKLYFCVVQVQVVAKNLRLLRWVFRVTGSVSVVEGAPSQARLEGGTFVEGSYLHLLAGQTCRPAI